MYNLQDVFNILNFWINKYQNSWYTISELTDLLDNGQMSYYTDLKPKYATSNLVKEILSPFRATYDFASGDIVSGTIIVPSNSNYLDLLTVQITYQLSNRTMYWGVPFPNEDELPTVLNSQIDPVTVTSPVGQIIAPRYFKLYPTSGYTGTVTYFRRPTKPVFAYTIVSGRVVVYNDAASTQLEWRDTDIQPIVLKALKSIGINLSSQEIAQWSEAQTQANFAGVNRI